VGRWDGLAPTTSDIRADSEAASFAYGDIDGARRGFGTGTGKKISKDPGREPPAGVITWVNHLATSGLRNKCWWFPSRLLRMSGSFLIQRDLEDPKGL